MLISTFGNAIVPWSSVFQRSFDALDHLVEARRDGRGVSGALDPGGARLTAFHGRGVCVQPVNRLIQPLKRLAQPVRNIRQYRVPCDFNHTQTMGL
jgi:hypothetical protein